MLSEMLGWKWDGVLLQNTLRAHTDDLWLLLVIVLLLFTVAVQGIFYPLFYKQFHFQAPSAIRWPWWPFYLVKPTSKGAP